MTVSFAGRANGNALQLESHLRSVETFVRAGDMPRAMRAADDAVAQGFEHPNLLTLAAYDRINRGSLEDALALSSRARELAPRSADVLNVLGVTLAKLNRFSEAVAVFDGALRQSPGAVHVRFNKGRALEDLGETKRARRTFERVLDLQPVHAEALARLASMAAQRGDVTAARDYAERSLKIDPQGTAAPLALALADIEEKKFEQALARLRPLSVQTNSSDLNRAITLGLMGDALDGLNAIPNAFAAYGASKSAQRELYRGIYEAPGIETAAQRIARLIHYFRHASPVGWRAKKRTSEDKPTKTHVFLVGFPRSGTTLLERVLDSNPDIEAMPERDCLIDAVNDFILTPGGLDRLASLDEDAIARYRASYLQRVSDFGITSSRQVFVDKLPLNAVLLCLVAKLFPDAKILFALRDPRDCVFSCFRRRFGMTAQMYELLTLDGAARYYDAVMTLSAAYKESLDLDTYYLRYEDLVADFDEQIERACAFLGIEWSDAMRDFAAKTRAVDINTPSAAQVARGLYNYGVNQWRRYNEQLAPVMPILAPWVAHFGYPQD